MNQEKAENIFIPIETPNCIIEIAELDKAFEIFKSINGLTIQEMLMAKVNKFEFEKNLTVFEKDFLSFHRFRLESLLNLLDSQIKRKGDRVLNVGLSVFDLMVKEKLLSKKVFNYFVSVPSLSFGKSDIYEGIKLIELDICNPKEPVERYKEYFDFIVFSGVLEHLFCDDVKVLKNLQMLLRQNGSMFLTVPNAASFTNRVQLARGKNIHWSKHDIMIGTEFGGYGHIREYTKSELLDLLSPLFNIVEFVPINDYPLKGFNFGVFNKLIPTNFSIDIGVLVEKK